MMSMRLSDELTNQLDVLATATGRSKSFLAGQAIRDYIERESWQIAEITQALREADNGEFASDDEVNTISAKWDELGDFPSMGRPGRVPGTRELVIGHYPYVVPYRVVGDELHVLRVFHTRRKPLNKW